MKNLVVTAWTGMTIRNLFFGSTFNELANHFNLTVLSHYGEQLKRMFPSQESRVIFDRIRIPRWQLPQQQGNLNKKC